MMLDYDYKRILFGTHMSLLIFNEINIYLQGWWLRMFSSKLLFYHRSPQSLSMLFIYLNCVIIFNQYWPLSPIDYKNPTLSFNIIVLTKGSFPFRSFICRVRSYRFRIAATLVCLNWIASVNGVCPHRSLQSCLTWKLLCLYALHRRFASLIYFHDKHKSFNMYLAHIQKESHATKMSFSWSQMECSSSIVVTHVHIYALLKGTKTMKEFENCVWKISSIFVCYSTSYLQIFTAS